MRSASPAQDDARLLNITTPGHERFVRAAGDPAAATGFPPAGPPDMPRLLNAAEAFGTAMLGPPPELAEPRDTPRPAASTGSGAGARQALQ